MTGQQIINAIRGYIDFAIGWLKWATGAAIAVALFVMVASGDVTTWAYLAGIYWLIR